ncbi:MAG: hypothetical protein IJ661_07120 [Lachnospiraceae bacterium]|nr:hypothetical protein [Lachnospiraceae bacterium]
MKDIISSELYSIRKTGTTIRIYILFIFIMILVTVVNIINDDKGFRSAEGCIVGNPTLPTTFSVFIIGFIVAAFCGEDFRDKTENYEVMSGHSRAQIFLGRSIPAILAAGIGGTLLAFLPLISGSIIFDTGDLVPVGDIIIRQLLFVFPFMRLAAFFVFVTFMVKSNFVTMILGFLVFNAHAVMSDMITNNKNYLISLFNLNLLTDYPGWSLYNVSGNGGVIEYTAYKSAVTPELIIGTIVVSLLMIFVYMLAGYAFFRRDDLG